ncbi:MAG TPA: sodium:proton antiporter [Candidatus Paceibacterota bacterium]|nr:sodium:proton antiporter [Candidatus Paceibacterota bacterium]
MESTIVQPNPWMIVPFGVLLAMIALAPLFFADWWSKHYAKVAYALGAVTLAYYLFGLNAAPRVLATTHEYVSFIALIGSLFVVSGGIHINVKGEATPMVNVIFLLVGAVIANLLGTTGASMLLIRPWIRMNKYRITAHHIVFFIFIVSNVGGCLTPIGDPPLFLGYLYGIPFWWVAEHCLPMWACGIAVLLAMFYVVDRINFSRAPRSVAARETAHEHWRFDGLSNVFFLAIILASVFIKNPPFLRECLMVAAAVGSYFTTKKPVHEANHFDFHPIKEVAVLFVGIFATMMPALDWLGLNAKELLGANPGSGLFYWGSGTLSSVLDNAPTYLSFLSATFGSFVDKDIVTQVQHLVQTGGTDLATLTGVHAEEIRNTFAALQRYHGDHVLAKGVSAEEIEVCFLLGNAAFNKYILAISIGAVFFGANTYIGNGPNFMVKSIADQQKVHTPSFLGYVFKYTLPFMVPMLVLIWWIFFRH